MIDIRRHMMVVVFVLACGGCASDPAPNPDNFTLCTEPRPEACTMEYDPVCGYLGAGDEDEEEWRSFGSACTACSFEVVLGYIPGEC